MCVDVSWFLMTSLHLAGPNHPLALITRSSFKNMFSLDDLVCFILPAQKQTYRVGKTAHTN